MKQSATKKIRDLLAFIHVIVRTLYYVLQGKKKDQKK